MNLGHQQPIQMYHWESKCMLSKYNVWVEQMLKKPVIIDNRLSKIDEFYDTLIKLGNEDLVIMFESDRTEAS